MNTTNRTLYLPLYGKALVSTKGIILADRKAEAIWTAEGFPIHGKAKSKWLAYFMSMRAHVMDEWLKERLQPATVVLHLGCGLDARCERVVTNAPWFDVDMPDVIEKRRQYFEETEQYRMLGADLTSKDWINALPMGGRALVVMEGVSMYLPFVALQALLAQLEARFDAVDMVMDVYTGRAVRMSAWGNPIRTVGARACTGVDDPVSLAPYARCRQIDMTPESCIRQLQPMERLLFRSLYAGRFASSLYKLYSFTLKGECE